MNFRRRKPASGPPRLAAALDPALRPHCALWTDGRCKIAAGHEYDPALRTALLELRRTGAVAGDLVEETATPGEIAAAWRSAQAADGADPAILDRVRSLFSAAARARASDVAFELAAGECRVYAIVNDRKLPLAAPLAPETGRRAMGYLFHSKDEGSGQTSYQRHSFQGFSIRGDGPVPLPEEVSALRCQRGPHEPDGDHLFARIFYRDTLASNATLEQLGFSGEEAAAFAGIRAALQGGVFIGGSTGDGKSTTLATNLALQMAETGGTLNMVTLEDPVEYPIPGAVQIAVPTSGSGEERSRHYKEALSHFCRVHPASGMVSEIRDAEGARQVLQFVDTGHQIWTTIHVDNANAILFRLLDLGVSAAEVCKPGNVALLMKQTLLPELCPSCALTEPTGPLPPLPGLRSWPQVRFRNPAGCERCSRAADGAIAEKAWNGYAGQTALAESIRPDDGYLDLVRRAEPGAARRHWTGELGGVPIGRKIWERVAQGRADPRDALLKGARPERGGLRAVGAA